MIGVEIVKTMTEYNYAYQEKLWACIMQLTDEQFLADVPYSIGSVRNHMVHLATVDGGWLQGIQESPAARQFRYEPEDYTTREAVHKICQQSATDILAFIDTLDDERLIYHPKGLPTNIWQTLLHLVNHGTDHRAQVLRALNDFGVDTIEQDAVFYHIAKQA